jgi:hypothetical protein
MPGNRSDFILPPGAILHLAKIGAPVEKLGGNGAMLSACPSAHGSADQTLRAGAGIYERRGAMVPRSGRAGDVDAGGVPAN